MAMNNFIPEIWNAQMLQDFRAQATAAALTNSSYTGDARVGNTVRITTAVDIAMHDYAGNSRTTTADSVDVTYDQLLIDQEKSFDFLIDDIDRAQAAGSLDVYTQSAGRSMALDADAYILSTAADGAATGNALDGTLSDASDALDVLRDLRKALNKANVPLDQRVAFVNAEFASILLGSESKLTAVDTSGDGAGLRDGTLGRILGFRVVETENLPVVEDPQVIAWYTPSVAFVSQIAQTEAMRDQDTFSDRIRGLHVYGAKVIRPNGVATWNVTPAGGGGGGGGA